MSTMRSASFTGEVSHTVRRCPDLRPVVWSCTAFMPNTVLPTRPPLTFWRVLWITFIERVTRSIAVC